MNQWETEPALACYSNEPRLDRPRPRAPVRPRIEARPTAATQEAGDAGRAIGVIYRPEAERANHYFQAILPDQFDDYIWFEQTAAVKPFATKELEEMPDTYPFGV